MHLSKTLLNAERTDMGRKLPHEERGPGLKIGITLAIFKLSGNIPCLSVKFIMYVTGRNISSAAEDNSKGQ